MGRRALITWFRGYLNTRTSSLPQLCILFVKNTYFEQFLTKKYGEKIWSQNKNKNRRMFLFRLQLFLQYSLRYHRWLARYSLRQDLLLWNVLQLPLFRWLVSHQEWPLWSQPESAIAGHDPTLLKAVLVQSVFYNLFAIETAILSPLVELIWQNQVHRM